MEYVPKMFISGLKMMVKSGLEKLILKSFHAEDGYSCMSLYMQWPLRNFYTLNHLVDSYSNTITKWAVGFRYGNFTLKLARGRKSLAFRGPTALGRQDFLPVG